jgi:hypothetical protein
MRHDGASPTPKRLYRCHVCRLELVLEEATNRMKGENEGVGRLSSRITDSRTARSSTGACDLYINSLNNCALRCHGEATFLTCSSRGFKVNR